MNLSNNTYLVAGSRRTTQPIGMRLSEWYQRLRVSWAQRSALARQMQELYQSSDRELLDMGLSRSDLPEIAKGTYRRE
jgi:uncharacterized protein YjiS (DUF1127 family)